MTADETITRFLGEGSNQSGLRDRNARLVLSVVRRHGGMPSAEIARRSGLSAQTVSNIIRSLEADGLLTRGQAIRGKVGKPSIPVTLNPKGVNSLGLNIGRRSAELVLVDFNGRQIEALATTYPYPLIEDVFAFLTAGMEQIYQRNPAARRRVTGIGIARPGQLWNWLEVVKAPKDAMREWQDIDIGDAIAKRTGLPTFTENDATSACVAEHLLGRGSEFTDFAYIFVGAFVGAGLVLNGKVFPGRTNNAAALGPLPVPDGSGGVTQLLNLASLYGLEHALSAAGIDPQRLRLTGDDWTEFEPQVAPWLATTSRNLAIAAAAIASVVEVEAILIDGAMPGDLRRRLVEGVRAEVGEIDLTGLPSLSIEEATVGRGARSIGAALLPIHARYFLA